MRDPLPAMPPLHLQLLLQGACSSTKGKSSDLCADCLCDRAGQEWPAPRKESWMSSPPSLLPAPGSPHCSTYPLPRVSQHPPLSTSLHWSHCMSVNLSLPDNNDSTAAENVTSALCLPPAGRHSNVGRQATTWVTSTSGHSHAMMEQQAHKCTPSMLPSPRSLHPCWSLLVTAFNSRTEYLARGGNIQT